MKAPPNHIVELPPGTTSRTMNPHVTSCVAGVLLLGVGLAEASPPESVSPSASSVVSQESAEGNRSQPAEVRRFRADEVYDAGNIIRFRCDFRSGQFDRLKLSEDDRYGIAAATPARLSIVDAPSRQRGEQAARFVVPRQGGSFRSEVALPHEDGFQERWYSARIFIPEDWQDAPEDGNDIVMQWHAIPGNWRATYPNMALNVDGDRWKLKRSFGAAQTGPDRDSVELAPLEKGVWAHWIFHVKWSPGADGIVRVWKDKQPVLERTGPNVYSTIGIDYTPYLKTGIYHPAWKSLSSETGELHQVVASQRVVYVTDIAVADERASLETFTSVADNASADATAPHSEK